MEGNQVLYKTDYQYVHSTQKLLCNARKLMEINSVVFLGLMRGPSHALSNW
jgi:hypothetical protein